MKETYKSLREVIEAYFDKKLKHSTYYGLQEIWDIVEDCVCDIQDVADKYDEIVDDFIEDCEEKREEERIELRGKGIII